MLVDVAQHQDHRRVGELDDVVDDRDEAFRDQPVHRILLEMVEVLVEQSVLRHQLCEVPGPERLVDVGEPRLVAEQEVKRSIAVTILAALQVLPIDEAGDLPPRPGSGCHTQEVEVELSLVAVKGELPDDALHLRADMTAALEERTVRAGRRVIEVLRAELVGEMLAEEPGNNLFHFDPIPAQELGVCVRAEKRQRVEVLEHLALRIGVLSRNEEPLDCSNLLREGRHREQSAPVRVADQGREVREHSLRLHRR